jgi:hypothetical protein
VRVLRQDAVRLHADEGKAMTFNAKKTEFQARWRQETAFLDPAYDASIDGDDVVAAARRILAVAHHVAGVACARCDGNGYCAYGSTSTWRGGTGGQAITADVCDECWGSGRSDRKHGDQRRLRQLERAAAKEKP